MIHYKNRELGWEVSIEEDTVKAKSLKLFGGQKFVLSLKEYEGIELRFESNVRTTASSDHTKTDFGYAVWLVHEKDVFSVPIHSIIRGHSSSRHGKSEVKLEVRSWAENFCKEYDFPMLRRNAIGETDVVTAVELDIPLKDRLDKSDIRNQAANFENHRWFKWKEFPDHMEVILNSRKMAVITMIFFWAIAATFYLTLPVNWRPLSMVVAFIGLLIIIWGNIKTTLKIYSDRFEFKSRGALGMAKKEVSIPFTELEVIQLDKNPGLNGVNTICFCSDNEIFYIGMGAKLPILQKYVALFSVAVVDHSRFRELVLNSTGDSQ